MKPLRLVGGGVRRRSPEKNFVCPWCGLRTETRKKLDEHWFENPRCRNNRSASNQTQTKYGEAGDRHVPAGEETIRKIRSKDCGHFASEPVKSDDGTIIGRQCTNCYTYLEVEF